jgi:hypothetical protein
MDRKSREKTPPRDFEPSAMRGGTQIRAATTPLEAISYGHRIDLNEQIIAFIPFNNDYSGIVQLL